MPATPHFLLGNGYCLFRNTTSYVPVFSSPRWHRLNFISIVNLRACLYGWCFEVGYLQPVWFLCYNLSDPDCGAKKCVMRDDLHLTLPPYTVMYTFMLHSLPLVYYAFMSHSLPYGLDKCLGRKVQPIELTIGTYYIIIYLYMQLKIFPKENLARSPSHLSQNIRMECRSIASHNSSW